MSCGRRTGPTGEEEQALRAAGFAILQATQGASLYRRQTRLCKSQRLARLLATAPPGYHSDQRQTIAAPFPLLVLLLLLLLAMNSWAF